MSVSKYEYVQSANEESAIMYWRADDIEEGKCPTSEEDGSGSTRQNYGNT